MFFFFIQNKHGQYPRSLLQTSSSRIQFSKTLDTQTEIGDTAIPVVFGSFLWCADVLNIDIARDSMDEGGYLIKASCSTEPTFDYSYHDVQISNPNIQITCMTIQDVIL